MNNETPATGIDTEAVRTLGSGLEFTGLGQLLIGGLLCLFGVISMISSFLVSQFSGGIAGAPANMATPELGLVSKRFIVFAVVYVAVGVFLFLAGMKARAGRAAATEFMEDGRIEDVNKMLRATGRYFVYMRYLIITIVVAVAVMFIFVFTMIGQMMSSMPHGG